MGRCAASNGVHYPPLPTTGIELDSKPRWVHIHRHHALRQTGAIPTNLFSSSLMAQVGMIQLNLTHLNEPFN